MTALKYTNNMSKVIKIANLFTKKLNKLTNICFFWQNVLYLLRIMYKPLNFLILFLVCLMGCGDDSLRKTIENEIEKIDGKTRRENCEKLKKFAYENKNVKKEFLIKDKRDSIDTDKFIIYLRDSIGFGCDENDIRIEDGPYNVNVFMKNTRSMFGYVNAPNSHENFKAEIKGLLKDIEKDTSFFSLHYINSSKNVLDSTKNIDSFVSRLNSNDFEKVPKKGKSSKKDSVYGVKFLKDQSIMSNIVKTAIDNTNDTSMSIIISDLNFSPGGWQKIIHTDSSYKEIIGEQSRLIKKYIDQSNVKDLSMLIIRLESDFFGTYFDINNSCYINQLAKDSAESRVKYLSSLIKVNTDSIKNKENEIKEIDISLKKEVNDELEQRKSNLTKDIKKLEKRIIAYEEEKAYYEESKDCTPLAPIVRPYFVWIFGTVPQIEKVLETKFIQGYEKNIGDKFNISKYIKNKDTVKFTVQQDGTYKKSSQCSGVNANTSNGKIVYRSCGNDVISIKNTKNRQELEIPVLLNFGRMAKIIPKVFNDTGNYKIDTAYSLWKPRYDIESLSDKNWTHRLTIHAKLADSIISEAISKKPHLTMYIEKTHLDNWVSEFSSESDISFEKDPITGHKTKKTPALNVLLRNVHNAFYGQSLDSIKIGVEK